jgi:hypothetical protein
MRQIRESGVAAERASGDSGGWCVAKKPHLVTVRGPRAAILAVHGFSMLLPPLSLCDSGPDDSPRLSIGMGFFRAETHPGLLHLRLRPATGAARGLTTGRRRAGPPYRMGRYQPPRNVFPGATNRESGSGSPRRRDQNGRLVGSSNSTDRSQEEPSAADLSPSLGHPYLFRGGLAWYALPWPWVAEPNLEVDSLCPRVGGVSARGYAAQAV